MKDIVDSLAAQFGTLEAERERTWERAKLESNRAQRRALLDAFDPLRAVKIGDRVASFQLELPDGSGISLEDLSAERPLLLIFFRFSECPACNIALPYYDRQLRPALEEAGIGVVAVSPHLPERGLGAIGERHGLGLRIASDRNNVLARRFGLTFLPPGDPPKPEGDKSWVGSWTGTDSWELPQPAIILIGADHIVRFVEVSPDWLDRPEAPAIIDAVNRALPQGA